MSNPNPSERGILPNVESEGEPKLGIPRSVKALIPPIDYAGWQFPANLSLEDAFRNYITYKLDTFKNFTDEESTYNLRVQNFVVQADDLPRLTELIDGQLQEDEFVDIAVLGGEEQSGNDVLEQIDTFLITNSALDPNYRVNISAVELPFMSESDVAGFRRELQRRIGQMVETDSGIHPPIYVEVPYERLSAYNPEPIIRYKMRLGNETGPRANAVLDFIRTCWRQGRHFKFTAGLHDPFTHMRPDGQTEFGYVNVSTTSALVGLNELGKVITTYDGQLKVLEGTSPDTVIFTEDGIIPKPVIAPILLKDMYKLQGPPDIWWHGPHQSVGRFDSIGSCSFEEANDGLRQLTIVSLS